MKICDSCSAVTGCLVDKTIAWGLEDGDWGMVHAELCTTCARKLDKMEIEARDNATLKAHWEFLRQMDARGYESLRKRPTKRIPAYP
jgi:hypothetical protein